MKIVLTILIVISVFALKAQNTYKAVGATAHVFFPLGSKPKLYRSNNANSWGIFAEKYYKNNFKLRVEAQHFASTFEEWYYDTSLHPQLYKFSAGANYIVIPFTASFNFSNGIEDWEFFTSLGFSQFIRYNYEIYDFNTRIPLLKYDRRVVSDYFSYLTVGISGRYKYSEHIRLGAGTTSYHFLKLNDNSNNGYPSLSVNAEIAYCF